jgi:hypothetical protein
MSFPEILIYGFGKWWGKTLWLLLGFLLWLLWWWVDKGWVGFIILPFPFIWSLVSIVIATWQILLCRPVRKP